MPRFGFLAGSSALTPFVIRVSIIWAFSSWGIQSSEKEKGEPWQSSRQVLQMVVKDNWCNIGNFLVLPCVISHLYEEVQTTEWCKLHTLACVPMLNVYFDDRWIQNQKYLQILCKSELFVEEYFETINELCHVPLSLICPKCMYMESDVETFLAPDFQRRWWEAGEVHSDNHLADGLAIDD